ncbi:Sodium/calcium exchanger protein-domain-containing protein [Microdochium trichocladiopsis]|uniref:Vacuolar calcium ion transporter n=1 Tax=Microdochium trichocladiopsis TaxID=1682393 RepID=A0A9P8XZS0_9PEZI|nr:Sodium/calcium exchanger protein-domain-containing protein [Microdochium trichocladiopsis]KAH7021563.1 Sodium/calcium exchanger protein-domain-containing protein [Microdochium trichocladiopsis]
MTQLLTFVRLVGRDHDTRASQARFLRLHVVHASYAFWGLSNVQIDLESDKPWVKHPAHVRHITKMTLLSNPINILLVCVPIGIIAGQGDWDPIAVFTINFFAIIPLAAVLSFATEEISDKLGESLGGLLNATFGNAVELIVSIIALQNNQLQVVKSSMIGSILSNILLVKGMCFFFGGIVNMRDGNGSGTEQSFASITAQTTSSLMTLSAASMILPGTLFMIINPADDEESTRRPILALSRGTAIILLLLYVILESATTPPDSQDASDVESNNANQHQEDDEEEEKEEHMSPWSAGLVLIVTTVLVSIGLPLERTHISRNFIGLILIPIVGNAAEHITAVVVAVKNKMDLAMGVAIGSSIQIALFVTPLLVILGWIMDRDMDLHFETFETVSFAQSVLVVIYTVMDGKSNYLEGAMLMALYIIIALAFFVTPSEDFDNENATLLSHAVHSIFGSS